MSAVEALRVRAMTTADIDAIMALERRSDGAPHWAREDYLTCMRGVCELGPQRIGLVADFHNVFAGFSILRSLKVAGETEIELESIVVSGEFRGRGIGASLLNSSIALARSQGARHLDLEVRESNRAAMQLYTRFGFVATGWRRAYYQSPEEDAVLMSLAL